VLRKVIQSVIYSTQVLLCIEDRDERNRSQKEAGTENEDDKNRRDQSRGRGDRREKKDEPTEEQVGLVNIK
jgi:hypothetical protein